MQWGCKHFQHVHACAAHQDLSMQTAWTHQEQSQASFRAEREEGVSSFNLAFVAAINPVRCWEAGMTWEIQSLRKNLDTSAPNSECLSLGSVYLTISLPLLFFEDCPVYTHLIFCAQNTPLAKNASFKKQTFHKKLFIISIFFFHEEYARNYLNLWLYFFYNETFTFLLEMRGTGNSSTRFYKK